MAYPISLNARFLAQSGFKRILTAATAFTLLDVSGAAPAFAQDESEMYFYPARSWTVGLSDLAPQGTLKNCAMRTTFNNGFVVQFDGSNKWVERLHINFRQAIFESGNSYEAVLSVPGGKPQTGKAQALSPEILTIDIADQKRVYKDLRTGNVLDVSVEGNQFRFYLVGFADAAKDFEACMSGGEVVEAAADDESAQRTAALHNATVNESVAYERQEASQISDQSAAARAAGIQEIIPDQAPAIISEVDARTSSGADSQAEAVPLPAPEEATRAQTVNAVTATLETQENAQTDLITTTGSSSVPLPADITPEDVPTPARANVTKQSAKVEADFTNLPETPSYADDPMGNAELAEKISRLERMVNELEQENSELNSDLSDALSTGKQERLTVASENWNLEQATMRYNEAERQLKQMGQKLQRERAQCSLEKKELETMLFDPQVTSQQQMAKLAELESALADAQQKLESQRMQYEERLKILNAQLQAQ